MKTGGIIKQTYFMKNSHGKSLKKLHVNLFNENISNVFFGDYFSLSKLLYEFKQYSIAIEKSYLPK